MLLALILIISGTLRKVLGTADIFHLNRFEHAWEKGYQKNLSGFSSSVQFHENNQLSPPA